MLAYVPAFAFAQNAWLIVSYRIGHDVILVEMAILVQDVILRVMVMTSFWSKWQFWSKTSFWW